MSPALKPIAKKEISTTAVVVRMSAHECAVSLAGFHYSDSFEIAVGRVMPFGVGEHKPAVLFVVKTEAGPWEVIAVYADLTHPVLLWVQDQKPNWVTVEKWKCNVGDGVRPKRSRNRQMNRRRKKRRTKILT